MTFGMILTTILISVTNLTITEPVDGETYDGDWLPLRAIVENENEVPDSVHYSLNGAAVVLIPRLNTDWPTYMQNNQNHGYSESPAPTDNTILWTAPVTGYLHEFPTPVVVDGIVYYTADSIGQGTTDSLYALDAATGELIWKYDTGHADDAVTVVDGCVYSASDSIFCLDAQNGERIWANGIADHMGGTPVIFEGKVYCGRENVVPDSSGIYCLDAFTGSYLWGDTLFCFPASCMAIWNGMLFVPTANMGGGTNGALSAFNLYTGELIWQNTDSDIGYWDSSPVVVDGVIYINDWYEKTFAFDAITGQKIWEQSTGGGTATIAYHNERLYFAGEGNGPYYCLDTSDGTTIWSVPGAQHGSSGIADDLVFYGESESPTDSSRVIALDCATGDTIWTFRTTGKMFHGSPSITDGILYIPAEDGNLYAFGTGLKYTYREDYFYADVGPNELIVTSFDGGAAVAADTINFTVTQTGINLEPSTRLALCASPNPFHSEASISFELSEPGWTSVTVYDLSGRIVRTLENSELGTGQHTIVWDGRTENGEVVSAGLYICRIQSGGVSETTGLCLLR
ncbi:MAG: PQQ-binding-like beta-propeller repeat protein [Candidatus Aegiribacteria sp.]|nr:PQQ-binding-like beta-propeller repeat protein [Candidatus Aegiribacteria sp.]